MSCLSIAATYVYGSYIDDVVSMRRGGSDYYFLHDDQWNIVALTDASGVVLERVRYGESGQPTFVRASDGATAAQSFFGNPYAFTGRRWDAATGLYYYRHRYYDPRTGRFTTRDPIGIWGDWRNLGNGRTYTANNAWSYVDPWGLECIIPLFDTSLWRAANPFGLFQTEGTAAGVGGNKGAEVVGFFESRQTAVVEYGSATGETIIEGTQAIAEQYIPGGQAVKVTRVIKAADKVNDARDAVRLGRAANELKERLEPRSPNTKTVDADPSRRVNGEADGAVRPVNGRRPRNHLYAGKNFKLPGELGRKYPNGVDFTPDGFPDFGPYSKHQVCIKMTGNHDVDARAANRAAGLADQPKDYVWHHHEDGTTMQLIPKDLHDAVQHTGGAAVVRGRGEVAK